MIDHDGSFSVPDHFFYFLHLTWSLWLISNRKNNLVRTDEMMEQKLLQIQSKQTDRVQNNKFEFASSIQTIKKHSNKVMVISH